MSRYTGNEPIEPFHVEARTVEARRMTANKGRCSAYSGESSGGVGANKPPASSFLQELNSVLNSNAGQAIVGMALAGVYILVRMRPAFSALTVLALLAAVLYRLDPRGRRIAAAPVVLAGAMLADQMVASGIDYAAYGFKSLATTPDKGAAWTPIFLAACLFFGPKFRTNTGKLLMALSLLLLGSGLVPGQAYVPILAMIRYLLFVAVAAGLGMDFKEHSEGTAAGASA